MQVRYDLSPDDVVTFSREAVKGTTQYQVQAFFYTVIGLVFMASDLLVLIVAVYLNDGSIRVSDVGTTILAKLVIWFILIGLMYVVFMSIARRSARKFADTHPGINGLYCDHLIELKEDGFAESTEVNRSFHSWPSVESIRETDNFVLITIRLGGTYFVPKRAFESELHRNSFISAADERIVQASVPPPPEL